MAEPRRSTSHQAGQGYFEDDASTSVSSRADGARLADAGAMNEKALAELEEEGVDVVGAVFGPLEVELKQAGSSLPPPVPEPASPCPELVEGPLRQAQGAPHPKERT
jgi:hypothetical protein